MKAVIINAKGFGGNNASSLVLSPEQTMNMLQKKFGERVITDYKKQNLLVKEKSKAADKEACHGREQIIYRFGTNVMDQSSVTITPTKLTLSEFKQEIELPLENPYAAFT